jgi:hypothetical protein
MAPTSFLKPGNCLRVFPQPAAAWRVALFVLNVAALSACTSSNARMPDSRMIGEPHWSVNQVPLSAVQRILDSNSAYGEVRNIDMVHFVRRSDGDYLAITPTTGIRHGGGDYLTALILRKHRDDKDWSRSNVLMETSQTLWDLCEILKLPWEEMQQHITEVHILTPHRDDPRQITLPTSEAMEVNP